MTKDRFEELFTSVLADPLKYSGFERRGKSLFCPGELEQFALIRGGGRFSNKGEIKHIVCFRHSFLRETTELTVPTQPPPYAEHYPFLLEPQLLCLGGPGDWTYNPENHQRLSYGRFDFSMSSEKAVVAYLNQLRIQLTDHWMPWGRSLAPEIALSQIQPYQREWWVARIWCEDYEKHLGGR